MSTPASCEVQFCRAGAEPRPGPQLRNIWAGRLALLRQLCRLSSVSSYAHFFPRCSGATAKCLAHTAVDLACRCAAPACCRPSTIACTRLGAPTWLGLNIIAWGLVSRLMGWKSNATNADVRDERGCPLGGPRQLDTSPFSRRTLHLRRWRHRLRWLPACLSSSRCASCWAPQRQRLFLVGAGYGYGCGDISAYAAIVGLNRPPSGQCDS